VTRWRRQLRTGNRTGWCNGRLLRAAGSHQGRAQEGGSRRGRGSGVPHAVVHCNAGTVGTRIASSAERRGCSLDPFSAQLRMFGAVPTSVARCRSPPTEFTHRAARTAARIRCRRVLECDVPRQGWR
jgi:hypothetical protein